MKLLNESHRGTDIQKQHNLVDQGVAVLGEILMPKSSVEVKDADKAQVEADHAHLFNVGVLKWEEPKKEEPVSSKQEDKRQSSEEPPQNALKDISGTSQKRK